MKAPGESFTSRHGKALRLHGKSPSFAGQTLPGTRLLGVSDKGGPLTTVVRARSLRRCRLRFLC